MTRDTIRDGKGPPLRRRWLIILSLVVGFFVLVLTGLVVYSRTDAFHAWVHRRVVKSLENTTGGQVELGRIAWSLSQLSFEAHDLTIHGLEAPGEEPLVHVDKIVLDAKILSWWGRQVGLRDAVISQPRVHIIVDRAGRLKLPAPRPQPEAGPHAAQRLFDLKLDHAELQNGVLIVNDRPTPLALSADDVQAAMAFMSASQQFDGTLKIGKASVAYRNFKPVTAGASVDFTIFPNKVQVKSLRIVAGKTTVDASGQVLDFNDPRAELTYSAVVDLAQAGDVMRLPELRRGTISVNGTGQYTAKNYQTTGKLAWKDTEYRSPSLVAPMEGGADFSADKNNIILPHFFMRMFGGVVTGHAEVKDWGNQPSGPEQQTRAKLAQQAGTIHAQVQAVQLALMAHAASNRGLPLDRLQAAGTVSGTVDATWRGTPSQMRVQLALNSTPPANAGAGELPVTAVVRGAYLASTQVLELSQLDLAARSLRVKASGTMSRSSQLSLSASVDDLRDVSTLLSAWSPQHGLPSELTGRATFSGTLSGRLVASFLVAGRLELKDVQVPAPFYLPNTANAMLRPASEVTQPRLVRFDSIAADIQYSTSQVVINNGVAARGAQRLAGGVTIGLVDGRYFAGNPLTAKASTGGFDLVDLLALAGHSLPLSGLVSGELDITGTQDDPRGRAQFKISGGKLYGEPVRDLQANVVFQNQVASFRDILIAQASARVSGTATYNLKSTAFRFDLSGQNINLAEFPQVQAPKAKLAGTLNFEAHGSGTREAPIVDADLHLRDLTLNGERMGTFEGTAKTTGRLMHIRGRSQSDVAEIDLDGAVTMRGDFPADLSLKVARVDVEPFVRMYAKVIKVTGKSSISGTIKLSGPLRQPRLLTVDGDLDQFSLEFEGVKIHNDGPLRFTVKDRILQLEQFKLAGADTTVTAGGTVALSGSRAMDLRAEGRVNLVLVRTFDQNLHTGGVMDFDVRAGGTVSRPTLFGNLKISDGAVTHIDFPNGLSNLNGTLVFNQDRLQVQQLTGTSGGGAVSLGGFVSYGNVLSFNLTGLFKDVRLRYPQGMSESLDADLRLTGTRDTSTLTGDITVVRFSVNQQFDMALAIAATKAPPSPPDPTSWLNNLRLNLRVSSAPDLQVTTSLAKLTGDLNLNIRGTATRPAVLGRINTTEGQIAFNGMNFQIDRGDISFTNPVKIEPVVDIAATTRVRDYDVTLGFHGPIDRLSTTYRSDPPLPTADIISLLAFGKTREESEMASAAQPTFSESASNAILGQALNAAVSSRVQRLFGASRVKIAPEVGGAESDPNAKVTIEQQVSQDFTVTYITDLTRSNQQSIQVEYNYSRNVSIIGARDQYGIVSFDVRIRQRKK